MAIYLLWRPRHSYDEYDAKVVRAGSEAQARLIANEKTGDEGAIWTDPELVMCERVYEAGDAVEVLGSFNAG